MNSQPPPAAPPPNQNVRRQLRVRCVREGREYFPHLADLTPEGLALWHHSSRQSLPVTWRQLLVGGADLHGMTDLEFLAFLAEQFAAAGPAQETLSGLSAPTAEVRHAGNRDPRRGSRRRRAA